MCILMMKVTLRASWVNSLKEKRMIIKSISQKLKNKFNVSVAEVDNQDRHKFITLGLTMTASDMKILMASKEAIETYIDGNTDAEIIEVVNEQEMF